MGEFNDIFENYMAQVCSENPDPSHDILHVKRVVATATSLGVKEKAELAVIIPAAYLHDCVPILKTDPRRSLASKISADKAVELLTEWKYPAEYFSNIHHSIVAHSFSAAVPAETLEAQIVQDADRLDAMGAIGMFRCFAFSGLAERPFYNLEDPFCVYRTPDDRHNTLDHFFVKLLGLHEKLHTKSAKLEGEIRLKTMKTFLNSLELELSR